MNDKIASNSNKSAWLPGATAVLAFILCNGTFVLIGLLSLLGISLTINPHLQAALISLFAILTLVLVYSGYKLKHQLGPLILAAAGTILVVGSMYIAFYKAIESVGLALLIAAAIWNWRINTS